MNPARESGEGAGGDAAEALTGAAPVGPGDAPPVQSQMRPEADMRRYPGVRPDIAAALGRYIEHGIEPGGFLLAVLANDLMGAMGRADPWNRAALFDICSYVYNELPSTCHGSYDSVRLWIAARVACRPR